MNIPKNIHVNWHISTGILTKDSSLSSSKYVQYIYIYVFLITNKQVWHEGKDEKKWKDPKLQMK